MLFSKATGCHYPYNFLVLSLFILTQKKGTLARSKVFRLIERLTKHLFALYNIDGCVETNVLEQPNYLLNIPTVSLA